MKRMTVLLFILCLCLCACTTDANVVNATATGGGKPYFSANTTIKGNHITIEITDRTNLDHAAIFDSEGNWIGDMIWDGPRYIYTIENVSIGTHNYQVKASSVPTIDGKNCSDADANISFVSAIVTTRATTTSYGTSGNGIDLKVTKIEPLVESTRVVLTTFEIHGFEDSYNKDGQVLVDIGNSLIEYFSANPEKLGSTTLYVIASANPDGLSDGWTNNGPGRCQMSKGVDINRDFDYCWVKRTNSRNKTLSPFSAPESAALRDLVINIRPNDVIDIHGWLGTTYGTASLCKYFQDAIGIGRSSGLVGVSGYFAAWAAAGYADRGVLIELPNPKTSSTSVINAFVALFN